MEFIEPAFFAPQAPDCCMVVPGEQGLDVDDIAAEAAGAAARLRRPVAVSAAATFLADGFFFMTFSSDGRGEKRAACRSGEGAGAFPGTA
ncbi:MAG: hypothetical protein P8Y78_06895 [Acidihalobacter sp.]